MADVKKVRISYVLDVEHEEFVLMFRAIGKVTGAHVKLLPTDYEALRALNVKLAKIRADTIRQMAANADAAWESARDLTEEPLPEGEA